MTNSVPIHINHAGGAWLYVPWYCRSADRYYIARNGFNNSGGFRLMLIGVNQ